MFPYLGPYLINVALQLLIILSLPHVLCNLRVECCILVIKVCRVATDFLNYCVKGEILYPHSVSSVSRPGLVGVFKTLHFKYLAVQKRFFIIVIKIQQTFFKEYDQSTNLCLSILMYPGRIYYNQLSFLTVSP